MTGPSASQRYFDLVRSLGEEMGMRHGWKSSAARRLGVHPSFISKIIAGEVQTVGAPLIERAIARGAIEVSYFFDAATPERCEAQPEPAADPQVEAMRMLASLADDDRSQVLAWANRRWPS